jgi:hypothetical protein
MGEGYKNAMTTRREFITSSLASTLLAGCSASRKQTTVPGQLLGAPSALGHRLRDGKFPSPSISRAARVVIAGGGIAGLAAAYELKQRGITEVLMLDVMNHPGGNASSGRNDISAYPWGAHYVPLARNDCKPVIELFQQLKIITDVDQQGRFVYDEYCISADPQERLWRMGRWQDGLIPMVGASTRDLAQYKKFFELTESLKQAKGRDGRYAFSIPLDQSSTDESWRQLDRINMHDYLLQQGFDSPLLHWYVNYCCRDDYGATSKQTSAWAALHYFAARNGVAANAQPSSVITWPEGNGHLVKELAARSGVSFQGNALVTRIAAEGHGAVVEYFDASIERSVRLNADVVIVCLPRFIAARVVQGLPASDNFSYAPWMVANLSIGKLPQGKGQPLSWDNVVYDSQMLGYVNATHQSLAQRHAKTVLTYYWPLTHMEPVDSRKWAISRPIEDWHHDVMEELFRIHPELDGAVENMDVWLWGHGMIRPTPGFIWGNERQASLKQAPPIFFAHSDMSGISIFEEAYCHGTKAAQLCAEHLKSSVTYLRSAI